MQHKMTVKVQLIFSIFSWKKVQTGTFTIICGSTFWWQDGIFYYHKWHHFLLSQMAEWHHFYYHGGSIYEHDLSVYKGDSFLLNPSAFESELHPLHKLRLCNGDFAPVGSKFTQAWITNADAFELTADRRIYSCMDILYPLCRLCRPLTTCPAIPPISQIWYCYLQEGGQNTIQRHLFIRMSKLPDVRGRNTYISSHVKQENLYAVHETTDRRYWTELARYTSRTSCYSFSQTALRKSTVWSAYQRRTITSERPITISTLSFRNGNCCPNP